MFFKALEMDYPSKQKRSGLPGARGVLLLSVCLNVALTAAVFLLFGGADDHSTGAGQQVPAPSPRHERVDLTNSALTILYHTNRFHWRRIESPDYERYAANLRAIGCPEATICDILLADLIKHYERRRVEISRSHPFWLAGRQRREAERADVSERLRLEQEEQEVIRRLLGLEWCGEKSLVQNYDLTEQALLRFFYGPMPEQSLQRMVFLLGKYDSLKGRLQEQKRGILTDDDEAQMKRWDAEYIAEVRQTLTPAQFDEASARSSSFELFEELFAGGGLELTSDEARQIAVSRDAVRLFGFFSDWPHLDGEEEQQSRMARFTNEVARILGDQRFQDFQRAQDRRFRAIYSFVTENHLSKQTAVKVYELRQMAGSEVARIREDHSLSEANRQEKFDEMAAEIEKTISKTLGAKVFEEYLGEHGSWITNLTRL